MWGTYRAAPLEQIPVTDATFVDLAAFRAFVAAARQAGCALAVATFGRADVAGKALEFALGADHGLVVTTPADFPDPGWGGSAEEEAPRCPEGSSWLGNKNRQLAALAGHFGVAARRTALFDDDPNNVQEALRAGVQAWHTPAGLTKAILHKAARALQLPLPEA